MGQVSAMMVTSDQTEPPRRQVNRASARITAHNVLRSAQFKPHHHTMSLIIDCRMLADMADDRGRVTWEQACHVAVDHSLLPDFLEEWAPKCCGNYDAGVDAYDLAYWLGY